MPSRSDSKRARLDRWLAEHKPAVVDQVLVGELKGELSPISESYLLDLLRHSGYPLSPEVEGVNTHSLEDLERTLVTLSRLYGEGQTSLRQVVIAAKDRLKWTRSRSSDQAKNSVRDEMILWTLTWLENPSSFPVWARLRVGVITRAENIPK